LSTVCSLSLACRPDDQIAFLAAPFEPVDMRRRGENSIEGFRKAA